MRERCGDKRRTEILETHLDLSLEDPITEEDMVVTLPHKGRRLCRQAVHRSTHDITSHFSSTGKVYGKGLQITPDRARSAWQSHRQSVTLK